MARKYGVFFEPFPVSGLEFMLEPALDVGDGRGSYSVRDKMLMLQVKTAMGENLNGEKEKREQRRALIWLIKYLLRENKDRMSMHKAAQTIVIRHKPDFLSPLPALEILQIACLDRPSDDQWRAHRELVESQIDKVVLPVGSDTPVLGNIAPWFLDDGLSREQCPSEALRQIEEWQEHCWVQHGCTVKQELPEQLREDEPRRSREDCWFKPGTSPNPKGRPKGSRNKSKLVRQDFFDEMVTVKLGGKDRRLIRREAFLRKVEEIAVARRDGEITRLLLDQQTAMSKLKAKLKTRKYTISQGSIGGISRYSVEGAIYALGGGDLLYRDSSTARMLLEPWVIELGVAHLGERRLSRQEQRIVLFFARHPKRTRWPSWWEPDLRQREKCA